MDEFDFFWFFIAGFVIVVGITLWAATSHDNHPPCYGAQCANVPSANQPAN
jgi:hypothetical protein